MAPVNISEYLRGHSALQRPWSLGAQGSYSSRHGHELGRAPTGRFAPRHPPRLRRAAGAFAYMRLRADSAAKAVIDLAVGALPVELHAAVNDCLRAPQRPSVVCRRQKLIIVPSLLHCPRLARILLAPGCSLTAYISCASTCPEELQHLPLGAPEERPRLP
jgi:hypothetical protein